MAAFLTILGFFSPIVKFLIEKFAKNAAQKEAWYKAWDAKLTNLQANINSSKEMKDSWDTMAAEQDARIKAAKEAAKTEENKK
jgi:hypothetical protein